MVQLGRFRAAIVFLALALTLPVLTPTLAATPATALVLPVVDLATPADDADAAPVQPPEIETFNLWPGRAPGALSDDPAETPTLTIVRPPDGWSNGTAVIIAPGGAYINLAIPQEGTEPAAWFASRGVTAFILKYRIGKTGRLPTPLLDGARAVRYVRFHAADFGIDPNRIGMLGFSAGGHLTASLATKNHDALKNTGNPEDQTSSRPDFAILAYPWLEGPKLNAKGGSDYCMVAEFMGGAKCDPKKYAGYLPLADVNSDVPPTFIFSTGEDSIVPAEGIIRFYAALRAANFPTELHIFEKGQHGSGMGGSNPSLSQWPSLLQEWMRSRGLLPDPEPGDSRP